MKRVLAIFLTGSLVLVAGCDLLDPTNVENPDILQEDFLSFPEPTAAWVRGLDRQMAVILDELIVPAEIASDNYTNTETFYNQFMDNLVFDFTDTNINLILREISTLREEAQFGLNQVVPADTAETPAQVAELHFYLGMAYLMSGEYFRLAPPDSAAAPAPPEQHYRAAVDAFNQAIELTTDDSRGIGYRIALARTYRMLGDQANARAQAQQVIDADPDYLRFAAYDNTNGPFSDIQDALYDRGTFDDLQPLPRLDFLDPKYFANASPNSSDDDDADVAFIKGEEAYLILAETQLATGELDAAKQTMRNLLELVADRPQTELVDIDEGRTQRSPGSRPSTSDFVVAFSPADTFHTGLVVSRTENFPVPVISGTHVTDATLDRVSGLDGLLEMLYLLRQEIFVAEGRRFVDLGLKWPVSEREVINNPNIAEGDPATEGVIPDFLPQGSEIDAFTIDEDQKQVIIQHNLNRILADNRTSALAVPLF